MKKLLLTFICLLAATTYANAETTTLFHESFGDNEGKARDWKDEYKVQTGIEDVYKSAAYEMTNAKQSKNTVGSTNSGLMQSITSSDAVFVVGPLDLSKCSGVKLSYKWKAGSVKTGVTYLTKIEYATSSDGSYTKIEHSATGATSFVDVKVDVPSAALVSTAYIKITFRTSNTQALIDEFDLSGTYTPAAEEYSVTFDENKMVTFSAPKAVDFSKVEGVTAYIASAVDEGYVTMTAVEDEVIEANTGLLLVADEVGPVKIPVSDNTGASCTGNLLRVWAAGAKIDASDEGDHEGYHAYVLGKVDRDFGFVYITKSHTNTSVNGRAYLLLEETFHGDSGSKKPKRIVFGGEQTGVESVAVAPEAKAEGIYNILGQPVDENYRGFVIRNGVKMYNR